MPALLVPAAEMSVRSMPRLYEAARSGRKAELLEVHALKTRRAPVDADEFDGQRRGYF